MVIRSRRLKWMAEVTRPGVEKCTERIIQDAAERTPRFWRGIASGEERVQ